MQDQTGQRVPEVTFLTRHDNNWRHRSTADVFAGRKVVLFSLPGAFTPTCSSSHLPRYEELTPVFVDNGIDDVVCLSVNDGFVMDAWAKDRSAADKVTLIADGNGDLAKALGLDFDGSGIGFGIRSQRYALVVNDGVVETVAVEKPMAFEVSSAEAILAAL